MTSASERADDDVVVLTGDDRMDQPRGAHAAEPADPELGGTELGGTELGGTGRLDNRDVGDDSADDSADTPRDAWGQGSAAQGSAAQRFPAQGSSYAGTGHQAPAGDAAADGPGFSAGHVATAGDEATDSEGFASADQPDASAGAGSGTGGPFAMPGASPADRTGTGSAGSFGQPGTSAANVGPTDAATMDATTDATPTSAETADATDAGATGTASVTDVSSPAAGTSAGAVSALRPEENWPEIQAMFVDDPRSAVERAAAVTVAAIDVLVTVVREREQSLRDQWQAEGTGTEELRTALRHYREMAGLLSRLSGQL